jgi:hypothetical protein
LRAVINVVILPIIKVPVWRSASPLAQPPMVLNPTPLQSLMPPPALAYAPFQAAPSQPKGENSARTAGQEALLLNLTKKMEDLAVNLAKDKERRPKQTNFRPNVWCTNCKGQGHNVTECPSPQNMKIQCQNCGKNHATEQCWYLVGKPVNKMQTMILQTQWDVQQVQDGPASNWNGPRMNNMNRNFQNYRQDSKPGPRLNWRN